MGGRRHADDQRFDLGPVEPDRTVRQSDVRKFPTSGEPFGPTGLPVQASVYVFGGDEHDPCSSVNTWGAARADELSVGFVRFAEVSLSLPLPPPLHATAHFWGGFAVSAEVVPGFRRQLLPTGLVGLVAESDFQVVPPH